MDIEKAIEYLTPIYNSASLEGYQAALGAVLDAARKQVEANANCPCHLRDQMELEDCDKTDCAKCCPVAMQQEKKNSPLTLEELRQMDGEPVYIVQLLCFEKKEWAIDETDLEACFSQHNIYRFEEYGDFWVAYRRPPVKEDA